MRPDSLLRLWRYINLLLTYLLNGVNGKPICDFLLVINCNLAASSTVFEIFRLNDRKLLILPTPPLFDAPALGNPLECRDEIWHQKTRIVGLPDGEEMMTLAFFVLTQYQHVTDGRTDRHVAIAITALA